MWTTSQLLQVCPQHTRYHTVWKGATQHGSVMWSKRGHHKGRRRREDKADGKDKVYGARCEDKDGIMRTRKMAPWGQGKANGEDKADSAVRTRQTSWGQGRWRPEDKADGIHKADSVVRTRKHHTVPVRARLGLGATVGSSIDFKINCAYECFGILLLVQ